MGRLQLREIVGWIRYPLLASAFAVVLPNLGGALAEEPIALAERPVPRLILALYDGAREAKMRWTRVHRYAELVLNQLGFQLVYHDISRGLPADTLDPTYAAVLSWFDGPVADSQAFAVWAAGVHKQGQPAEQLKFILFGETGLSAAAATRSEAQAFLNRTGIHLLATEHQFGAWGRLSYSDPALIGFERDFTVSRATLPLNAVATPGDAVSHLRVTEPESLGGAQTDLVVTAPTGAYVHGSALVRDDPDAETSLWILNPFSLFENVLGTELRPIPDTTTLNGRRLFFCTMQGDGWTVPLPADRLSEHVRLAGSMILDEVIAPYPDLPVSVALVTGDLDPKLGGRYAKLGADIARAAFSLPNVEVASYTRTLPLHWAFFENYQRDEEMQSIERAGAARQSPNIGLLPEAFSSLAEVFTDDPSRASAAQSLGLRKYIAEPFNLDAEIVGSLKTLQALAPPEHPASLMIWGGDSQVFEGALAKTRQAGVAAIGGGGGIYDPVTPSVSNLTPLSVQVGSERQIYNALGGDAVYTNFWTAPIHGLLRLQAVLDATERPRRLKPFQLSYSAFSALRFGSLSAVKTLLKRAREGFVAPIRTSHYVRIAEGFATVRIFNTGPLQWRIENRGDLQTVRFDTGADKVSLDAARCRGVLGSRRERGTLYVSLDSAEKTPLVALKRPNHSHAQDPHEHEEDSIFELDNSRWVIRDLDTDSCKALFKASGFGPGQMSWRVPRSGNYRVEIYEDAGSTSSEKPVYWDRLVVDDDKMLSVELPDLSGQAVHITMSCR